MLRLNEVVRRSNNASFHNDVQISDYRSPDNLALARSFIFVGKTVGERKGSLDLLKQVCEAYLPGNQPNRYTFIATYGHGKSHFALAMANYFGKPVGSPEVDLILENIRHAVDDEALHGYFADFKRHHRPLLVVALRGDDPSDLQTQFHRALEAALEDNESTRAVELPFWFAAAERFLQNIRPESVAVAQNYLAERQLDLSLLLQKVQKRESSARRICRDLHVYLYKVKPDFGTGISLREAVEWTVDNLCGAEKPLSGVLVLFDEFSAFVKDYAAAHHAAAGTPLQDLLNGISNRPEKSAFVAFSQHDPDTVAKSVLVGHPEQLASLQHELNRLPIPQRLVLYSSLEQVLDAYLKQDETAWEELLRDKPVGQAVFEATNTTLQAFDTRYSVEMKWSRQRFQQLVSMGCYPLSPMTTALLASVDFQSTSSPRSILGFVVKALDERGDQLAERDGRPNWIAPYELVDYFGAMLGEDVWREYSDALQQAGGADASASERRVLQAMLLQATAKVPTKVLGFERLVAVLADIPIGEAAEVLGHLRNRGVIRGDDDRRIFMFWPAGRTASQLERSVADAVSRMRLDQALLNELDATLRDKGVLPPLAVSVRWGHQDDWQAMQWFVTRDAFNDGALRAFAQERLKSTPEKREDARGAVLWAVAETAGDVEWYRQTVARTLDRELNDSTGAIVVMTPREASPHLVRLLLRRCALQRMTDNQIATVGRDQWEDLSRRELELLKKEYRRLSSDCGHEVPHAARSRIRAVSPASLPQLLLEVYELVYCRIPGEFFTQYKATQAALARAVAAVYTHLLDDSVGTPGLFQTNRPAEDLLKRFLVASWGIVERGSQRINPPAKHTKAADAWAVLDEAIPAKATGRPMREALTTLMNAPYGLDVNGCALLASAWCGYHRHDLTFSVNGRLSTIQDITTDPKKGSKNPRDFVASLAALSVTRRDRSELSQEVATLVSRTKSGSFGLEEADAAVVRIKTFIGDERNDRGTVNAAQAALDRLAAGIELARDYDSRVRSILASASRYGHVVQLCKCLSLAQELPTPSIVVPSEAGVEAVREKVRQRIVTITEEKCRELENLNDLTRFALQSQLLQSILESLRQAQQEGLAQRVARAQNNLAAARKILEEKNSDDAALAILSALPSTGPLVVLRSTCDEIGRLSVASVEAKQQVASKLKRVNDECKRLEAMAAGIRGRVASATVIPELTRLRESIISELGFFRDSPEALVVNQALGQCDRALECLSEIGRATSRPCLSPSDANDVLGEARDQADRFKTDLSDAQLAAVSAEIEQFERACASRREDALRWLEDREREAVTDSPIRVRSAIESPPAFLPVEAEPRLRSLEARLTARIDQDQVLLTEQQFLRITSAEVRKACIRRLEELVEVNERV